MKTTKWLPTILTITLFATLAFAGAIKQWSSGETLTSADLNANFTHIHANMVGGHGARLVDADVSASAAISHSKMATPALIPKAWMSLETTCGAPPCTETKAASSGVGVVSHTAAGQYSVTWSPARSDDHYAAVVTPLSGTAGICNLFAYSSVSAGVYCYTANTGAATNMAFNIVLLDDN